jgi:hypothetical protein
MSLLWTTPPSEIQPKLITNASGITFTVQLRQYIIHLLKHSKEKELTQNKIETLQKFTKQNHATED